jgi:hypothetical protein
MTEAIIYKIDMSFIHNIDPDLRPLANAIKLFYSSLTLLQGKLECLSLASIFRRV